MLRAPRPATKQFESSETEVSQRMNSGRSSGVQKGATANVGAELTDQLNDPLSDFLEVLGLGKGSSDGDKPSSPKVVVQPGDSLWAIAEREYGDGTRWREIYELNESVIGANPSLIQPGMVLFLQEKQHDQSKGQETKKGEEGPKSEAAPEQQSSERGEVKKEINSAWDAIQHYRSGAGGAVPAGEGLYNEIRSDNTYKKQVGGSNSTLANKIKDLRLRTVSFDEISGTINSSTDAQIGEMSTFTIGSFGFNVAYSAPWTATEWEKGGIFGLGKKENRTVSSSPEVNLHTDELWDFERNTSYGVMENFFKEDLPEFLLGKGKPFHITIDMKENYNLKVSQQR